MCWAQLRRQPPCCLTPPSHRRFQMAKVGARASVLEPSSKRPSCRHLWVARVVAQDMLAQSLLDVQDLLKGSVAFLASRLNLTTKLLTAWNGITGLRLLGKRTFPAQCRLCAADCYCGRLPAVYMMPTQTTLCRSWAGC